MRCVCFLHCTLTFALLGVLMSHSASSRKEYTDSLAVEVIGGKEVADRLATKHGFVNHGKVSRGLPWTRQKEAISDRI